MDNRIDALYGRQSVDRQDSISIESQMEFCRYELKGEGNFREYTDKGFSGKNTDRPRFQELVRDIERGLIKRVVVYKLDRISRSIIDFSKMMELFQRYNVEFVSSTEKFDTSTPMGRAMLNICIVFAQLERETIQKRVTDAYHSRCQKGFYMGGKVPYGYKLEQTIIDGVNTKKMVANPEAIEHIKLMFQMYAEPHTSFGDIARYFTENGVLPGGKEIQRSTLSYLLRNPIFVKADLDVYEFFKSQGSEVVNDAADFSSIHACYLYQTREASHNDRDALKDYVLVLAPHEGIVDSDTWLKCRKKLLSNKCFGGSNQKAKHTWLAGKIKCGRCGIGLIATSTGATSYFRCGKRIDRKACEGCGTLRTRDVEQAIHEEMIKRLGEFKILTGGNPTKTNPKLTALNVEFAQVENEIEKLINTLSDANSTLMSYANAKIEELDSKRQSLTVAIADASADAVSPEYIKRISDYLDSWDTTDFEDRRLVADGLIHRVNATSESVQIEWKI